MVTPDLSVKGFRSDGGLTMLREFLGKYFGSWWMPTALTVVVLGAFLGNELVIGQAQMWFVLLLGLLVSLFSILCASVFQFAAKAWRKGLVSLAMLGGTLVVVFYSFHLLFVLTFASMFGASEDGFADDLTIPEGIVIVEPAELLLPTPGGAADAFQAAMLAALEMPGTDDPSVTASCDSLVQCRQKGPDVLRRYLATSPSWRVFMERGNVFATRRWMIGSEWRYTLHGYYTTYAVEWWPEGGFDFETRLTIGFSGEPWYVSADSTQMHQRQTKELKLSVGNRLQESHCVITVGGLTVELFEQSAAKERRLTKAALAYLEAELAPLLQDPSWETIQAVLPPGGVTTGEPSLALSDSFQPGIYDSEIWVNPGEPGMLYLKAFEVTHGTPLSVDALRERSNEWVGWSDDASQLFLSNTHFTICEGDWGKPYAARFEVWFAPDSGGAERKLIEKVFKIEGWQR